ncbi:MAG: hypothetical protein AAF585_13680, partial [Verrucomicrobiota bacterium]
IVSICAIQNRGYLLADADGTLMEYFTKDYRGLAPQLENVKAVVNMSPNAMVLHYDGSLTPIDVDKGDPKPELCPPENLPPVWALTRGSAILEDRRGVNWGTGGGRFLHENVEMISLRSANFAKVTSRGWTPANFGDAPGGQTKEEFEKRLRGMSLLYNSGNDGGHWVHGIRVPSAATPAFPDGAPATAKNRYNLPAFHGELRPIPGTAGWRSKEPGKLVAFPVDEGAQIPRIYELMPEGLDDIVSFTILGSSHGFAIRADGTLVGWGNNLTTTSRIPDGLKDVIAVDGEGNGLGGIVLHRDGTVTAWPKNELTNRIHYDQPGEVISICAVNTRGYLLVTADGKLHEYFRTRQGSTPDLDDVRAVVSSHTAVTVLHRDGRISAINYGDNELGSKYQFPEDLPPVWVIGATPMAILEDRRAVSWKEGVGKFLENDVAMLPFHRHREWVYTQERGWFVPGWQGANAERATKALRGFTLFQEFVGTNPRYGLAIRP